MPKFSKRSLTNLGQCHEILQAIAHECIKEFDFTVVCGHRNEADQEKAFKDGFSKAHYGESPHNFTPALAFDAYKYPIDVNSIPDTIELAHAMAAAAQRLNLSGKMEWGGNFKGKFKDRPHFQLVGWRNYIVKRK